MNPRSNIHYLPILLFLLCFLSCKNNNDKQRNSSCSDSILICKYQLERKHDCIIVRKTNEKYTSYIKMIFGTSDINCFIFPYCNSKTYQFYFHFDSTNQNSYFIDTDIKSDLMLLSKFNLLLSSDSIEIVKFYKSRIVTKRLDSNFPNYLYFNKDYGLLAIENRGNIMIIEKNSLFPTKNNYNSNKLLKIILKNTSFKP